MQSFTALAQRAGIALLMALPCAALATPPSWAPAHGWRKQNDPTYAGYSGRAWDYDYGVRSGSCDRGRIGQVLGGVVGGVAGGAIGGEIAKGSTDRSVAIVIGTVIGGWQLARGALAAIDQMAAGGDKAFLGTQVVLAQFYAEHVLPRCIAHAAVVRAGSASTMALVADQF
jgi:hypothetical protein